MSFAAIFTLGYLLGATVVAVLIGLTMAARRRATRTRLKKRN